MSREALLARTLVELADTLVDDFDVVDLLTLLADRCVEVLDVSAAGIMLVAPDGDLRVMASSSEAMRVVELFELQPQEGPCLDCYRTRPAGRQPGPRPVDGRWPRFAPVAARGRVPLRRRRADAAARHDHRRPQPVPHRAGDADADDVVAAQALADVATIAILQHRAAARPRSSTSSSSTPSTAAIVIEQAKGIIAERDGARHGPGLPCCATTPATTTSAWPTSRASSPARWTPPPWTNRRPEEIAGCAQVRSRRSKTRSPTRMRAAAKAAKMIPPSSAEICGSALSTAFPAAKGR